MNFGKWAFLALSLTLANASFANQFACKPEMGISYTKGKMETRELNPQDLGWNEFKVEIQSNGKVFDAGRLLERGNKTECAVFGNGGRLYTGGDGPNSYGFRIPSSAFKGDQNFNLVLVEDSDSDGLACEGAIYKCTQVSN
ncbi:MAG: hypothetical protein ACXVLQ_00345 [Bacteriovorax sp.]